MPWYNTSWAYAIPVTVINGSSTSALSYAQVSLRLIGAAFASMIAHGKADLSDIVVTDLDGTTPLPFALEWIDPTNSIVYLLVKVSVPANSTKTIYVYYGNPAATSASNYPATIGATNAISARINVLVDPAFPYYNIVYGVICTRNQPGGSLYPNGTLVGLTGFGSPANGANATSVGFIISTDGGNTWTTATLMSGGIGAGFLFERANGSLIGFGTYSTFHSAFTSADGGNTWFNLPNGASPKQLYTSWPFAAAGSGAVWGMPFEDNAGNLYVSAYGKLNSADTVTRGWLMKCAAGLDPTTSSNWTNPGQFYNASYSLSEPTVIPLNATASNLLCILRNDTAGGTGDLYSTTSSDGGVTWSTVTPLGIPGIAATPNLATSPYLYRLTTGNLIVSYTCRNKLSATPNSLLGSGMLVSTDNGTTWLDRAPSFPSATPYNTAGANQVQYGESALVQRADGKLVMLAGESNLTNTNFQNVFAWIFDEDWAVNSPNVLESCQSTSAFINIVGVVTDTAHTLAGQANSLKFANAASTAASAVRPLWSTNPLVSSPATPNKALWPPSGISAVHWLYPASIGTTANGIFNFFVADKTTPVNRIGVQSVGSSFGFGAGAFTWYNGTTRTSSGLLLAMNQWNRFEIAAAAPGASVSGRYRLNNLAAYSGVGQWQAGGLCYSISPTVGGETVAGTNTFWLGLLYTQQYVAAVPTFSVAAEVSLASSGSASTGLAGATVAAAVTAASSGSVISASISVAGATAAGSVTAASPAASQMTAAETLAGATLAATMTALPSPSSLQVSLTLAGASPAASVVAGGSGGIQPSCTIAADVVLDGSLVMASLAAALPGAGRPLFVDPDLGSLILP